MLGRFLITALATALRGLALLPILVLAAGLILTVLVPPVFLVAVLCMPVLLPIVLGLASVGLGGEREHDLAATPQIELVSRHSRFPCPHSVPTSLSNLRGEDIGSALV